MAANPIAVFHLAGFFMGVIALAVIILDVSLLSRSNWDIFTSRYFLKKDTSRKYKFRLAYFLTVALTAITINHYVRIIGPNTTFTTFMDLLITMSLTIAIAYSYALKRILAAQRKES